MPNAAEIQTQPGPYVATNTLNAWLKNKRFSVFMTGNFIMAMMRYARNTIGDSYRVDFVNLLKMFDGVEGAVLHSISYYTSYNAPEHGRSPTELGLFSFLEKQGYSIVRRPMIKSLEGEGIKQRPPRFLFNITLDLMEQLRNDKGLGALVIFDTNSELGDLAEWAREQRGLTVIIGMLPNLDAVDGRSVVPIELFRQAHAYLDMSDSDMLEYLRRDVSKPKDVKSSL